MRWLKHLSQAHADPEVNALLEEYGPEPYGAWWLIIEHIATPMERDRMLPEVTHSEQSWAGIIHVSRKNVRRIFQILTVHRLIRCSTIDGKIKISVPNILKFKDEYTKKSGQTPASNPESVRRQTEREQKESRERGPRAPHNPDKEIPLDAEQRIRKLADDAPNPQDFETGVGLAVQELVSSANPEATLAAMEVNIPLWWTAMRDGRVRKKPLRFVIKDGDYLRLPPERVVSKTSANGADSGDCLSNMPQITKPQIPKEAA